MRLRITAKKARREGINLDGREKIARILARKPYAPGMHGPTSRTRQTDYGKQLREKQRAKLIYGISERQFHNYFEKAAKMQGDTSLNLMVMLEQRLDNVVYRSGLAKTRAAARQMVSHGNFQMNGKKANIPSIQVKSGDMIQVKDNKLKNTMWQNFLANPLQVQTPSWINVTLKDLNIKVLSKPSGEELKEQFDPRLITEFYSR